MSPDSGGIMGLPAAGDRADSRESPLADSLMKSPSSSQPNGFPCESKSPFQCHDDRPFKDEFPPHLGFKFEDRITGESLIPKGDPMEARLQEILRWVLRLLSLPIHLDSITKWNNYICIRLL